MVRLEKRVEVKGVPPHHTSGNFYMTKATLDNMTNKVENGLIDVVEFIRQIDKGDKVYC